MYIALSRFQFSKFIRSGGLCQTWNLKISCSCKFGPLSSTVMKEEEPWTAVKIIANKINSQKSYPRIQIPTIWIGLAFNEDVIKQHQTFVALSKNWRVRSMREYLPSNACFDVTRSLRLVGRTHQYRHSSARMESMLSLTGAWVEVCYWKGQI